MEAVKQNYAVCPKCNGEQVFNPRTQKVFCKAKCWLNQPVNTIEGQKVEVVKMNATPTDKDKSFKVSYAKDLAIAIIHECALLKVDWRDVEVMKAITDNSIMMVGAMWSRL